MQKELFDIPEETINTPKGSRILHTRKLTLFDEKGEPEYLLGISEDITDKKEAEKKIRENIERYDRLTMTVPGVLYDYIMNKDGSSQMIFMSSKCLEVFEVPAEEVMKDMGVIWKMIHPDDLERFLRENEETVRSGNHFNTEIRILPLQEKKNGFKLLPDQIQQITLMNQSYGVALLSILLIAKWLKKK
jgi:PAS domain-containing protein